MSLILHFIAALLWLLVLLLTLGVGPLVTSTDSDNADDSATVFWGVVFVFILASIAFTLQVLA